MVNAAFMDNPLFLSVAFHPRSEVPGKSQCLNVFDGYIQVDEHIQLGYRFYAYKDATPCNPVFLYFHGNGEIAADYDSLIANFRQIKSSLVVIDFRGYGWSTGKPLLTTLLSDCEKVIGSLQSILKQGNCEDSPVFVFGRSIGSCCAIHLATKYTETFKGIILESALTSMKELPMVHQLSGMIPDGMNLLESLPDPYQNVAKLSNSKLPLLVLHGANDVIVPGHNDLTLLHGEAYFAILDDFVHQILSFQNNQDERNENQTTDSILEKFKVLQQENRWLESVRFLEDHFDQFSAKDRVICLTKMAQSKYQLQDYHGVVESTSLALSMDSKAIDALVYRIKANLALHRTALMNQDVALLLNIYQSRIHDSNLAFSSIDVKNAALAAVYLSLSSKI